MENIFDIGCDDVYLLKKLRTIIRRQDGVDPNLLTSSTFHQSEIKIGLFLSVIEDYRMRGAHDAIFALAVFEHFSERDIRQSASVIARMLSPEGRLIITVPHPFVDKILDILIFLHFIDGQETEEHHGFNPESMVDCFSDSLCLIKHERFQFGLNNIFVFGRV